MCYSDLGEKPGAYGQLGLADLFELREECLREFGFPDVYRRANVACCWSWAFCRPLRRARQASAVARWRQQFGNSPGTLALHFSVT